MILGAIGQVGVDGGVATSSSTPAKRCVTLDGGADDDLQHVDRVGRPGRDDRPDDKTFATSKGGRRHRAATTGSARVDDWRRSPPTRRLLRHARHVDVDELVPAGDVGTNPGMVVPVTGSVPDPATFADPDDQVAGARRSSTWASAPGSRSRRSGSTASSSARARTRGSRICVRRLPSSRPYGRPGVTALVVPGSAQVRRQARGGGSGPDLPRGGLRVAPRRLLDVPRDEPRRAPPGERCASTSNRNFEGRQGRGGRTHLVSPQMAAAAALHGHFVDVRALAREAVPA